MNRESKSYTLLYSSALTLLVSLVLAFTAEILKERQEANEAKDKMRQILLSINVRASGDEVERKYEELIVETFLVNAAGERVEGDAFSINMRNEMALPEDQRRLPVYVAEINEERKYILELTGVGLWGPVWGQIALNEDRNTVFGANFEHDSETPGLGAEIHSVEFGHSFIGKRIFNDSHELVSIAVVKPGESHAGRDYVDGVSGGTITSHAVDAMLLRSLSAYLGFLTKENRQ